MNREGIRQRGHRLRGAVIQLAHELAPEYDLPRAQALLAEAGYPEGRGLPELRLLHPEFGGGAQIRQGIEATWAGQWQTLGVRLRQEWVPFSRLYAEVAADASFWEWGWVSDYPDPQGFLGTLLEQRMVPMPRDPDLSRLLERGRSSHSRDERLRLYREIDRKVVAEQTWLVPTMYNTWLLLRRAWVEGLWGSPLGLGTLADVVVQPHR